MGNNLVGVIVESMKKVKPNLTVMKIWNKNKLSIILAVHNPNKWETEMDPYYAYADGNIDGLTLIDNFEVVNKVMKKEYLIFDRTEN